MGSAVSYGDLLAANLGRLRRDRGLSQQELARLAAAAGLDWDRMTVAGIENGRRALTVGEWLLLPILLGRSPLDLLSLEAMAVDHIEVDGALLTPEQIAAVVARPRGGAVPVPEALASYNGASLDEQFDEFLSRETNRKVSKRMGWSVRHLITRSKYLWDGRELAAERERRLEQTAPPGASPRVLQALRGHITRKLIDELLAPRPRVEVLEVRGRRDTPSSTRKRPTPSASAPERR